MEHNPYDRYDSRTPFSAIADDHMAELNKPQFVLVSTQSTIKKFHGQTLQDKRISFAASSQDISGCTSYISMHEIKYSFKKKKAGLNLKGGGSSLVSALSCCFLRQESLLRKGPFHPGVSVGTSKLLAKANKRLAVTLQWTSIRSSGK